jgi:tRNA dimethylallyltransferase
MTPLQPLFLAGPTGIGKSAVALSLADKVGGEIISVDSMQVYRGLDIGTAKPAPEERARVRHHLIDIIDLTEGFDAAQFVTLARASQAGIVARGKVPIFCGGTGLYFRAFWKGLGVTPPSDPRLRAELLQTPLPELLLELERQDPLTFQRVDRANRRRVVRAVEVLRLTGKPFSAQRADWSSQGADPGERTAQSKPLFFALERDKDDLYRRIDERVDRMFEQGLVEETQRLLPEGLAENPIALQALGYRQAIEYLRGGIALAETVRQVKQRTRKFAKRQMTWFRREADLQRLTVDPDEEPDRMAKLLAERYWQASKG